MNTSFTTEELAFDPSSPIGRIQSYWNERIHDQEMTSHPPGSPEFFRDLEDYRFEKLHYLPRLVRFDGFRGKRLLEIGCGIGTDLVRFARGGARVTGVDLSRTALELARRNVAIAGVEAELRLADGEDLPFADGSFDVVYAHGVLPYTADPARMAGEARRVLIEGGQAILMAYNRLSWLNALSKIARVPLEHEDAPVLRKMSLRELRALLSGFRNVVIVPERFPVRSRLHGGWKGFVYNGCFVGPFERLPRPLVRRFGWHLMGFGER